jgi:hypothetical protein
MSGRDTELAAELQRLPVPEHGAGFWDDLRTSLDAAPAARRRAALPRLRWLAPAAAVMCAVAIAVVSLSTEAETATAADVRQAVEHALGSIDRIGGVLVVRESSGETRWRFTLDADGDFSARALAQPVTFAYSAAEGVERNLDTGNLTERTGVAPGPPDSQSSAWMVQRGLGSVVGALAAPGGEVEEVQYGGRDAWLLRTHTQNGETREVTVDRATGVPVRDVIRRGGRVAFEWRIDDLSVGGDPPATLAGRGGDDVTRWDNGFRRVASDDVEATVGYAPYLPSTLPAGFSLAEIAVAAHSRPTGNEQHQNPPSRDVVSALARRGLDTVVVTTRRVGADPGAWSDPVAMGDLSRAPRVVRLGRGPLAGARVELVVDPNAPLHLWGIANGLVFTVTGDVEPDELVQIAEGLTRGGDPARP